MIKKMDHVGLVVRDVEVAAKNYADMFGFEVVSEMEGPGGEFKSVMLANGDIVIEMLQPLKPGSVQKFLDERGGGLHHISFVTDDIEGELNNIKAQGKKLINEEPMALPEGSKRAFVHPEAAENVLIELVQRA